MHLQLLNLETRGTVTVSVILPLLQGAFTHEITWAATDHKGAVVGETSLCLGSFAGVLVLGCCWVCALVGFY